jgi:LacI family transcriptional regulator
MGGTVGDDLVRRLVARGTPVATMARTRIDGVPTIRVDNYASTLALTSHLIEDHGYRLLAFVGNTTGAPDATDRWAGFLDAHREAGIAPPSAPLSSAWEHVSGMQAAWQIMDMRDRPEAVVCGNDEIAIGMLSAFATSGVLVPGEIAVTGWDNIPLSAYTTPPLTTIAQPARALGEETARILLGMIDGASPPPGEVVLSTEPILRASCGCHYQPDIPRSPA